LKKDSRNLLSRKKIEPFKDVDIRPFAKVLSKAATYVQ